ncbi:hypothetical protein CLU79DRAFT_838214 [Phycomyces nitens]|nr:hypothetical protein CLU79DRAFT_838214 [Phycomyces nitens]
MSLTLLYVVVTFIDPLLSTVFVLDHSRSRPSARCMDSIAFLVLFNDEEDSVGFFHGFEDMTDISIGLNSGDLVELTCAPWVGVPFSVAFHDSEYGIPRDYLRSCASLETQDTCFVECCRFPAVGHLQNNACCCQALGSLGDNRRAVKSQMACTPVRQDGLVGQGPWLTFIKRERKANRLDRAFLWETKFNASMEEMFGDVVSSETTLPEPIVSSSGLVFTIGHEDKHSDASCEASVLSFESDVCPSSPSSFGEGIIDTSWYSYKSVDELSAFGQKVTEDEIVNLASLFESLSIDDVSDCLSSDQMSIVDDVPFVDICPNTVQQVGVIGEEFDLVPQCTESVDDLFVFKQGESMDIESIPEAHVELMETDFEDEDFDCSMSVISEAEPSEMEAIEYVDVVGAGFSATGSRRDVQDFDVQDVEDVKDVDVKDIQDTLGVQDGENGEEDKDDKDEVCVVTGQSLLASCDALLADLELYDDVEADSGVEACVLQQATMGEKTTLSNVSKIPGLYRVSSLPQSTSESSVVPGTTAWLLYFQWRLQSNGHRRTTAGQRLPSE